MELRRVGLFLIVLGVVGIVRFIPELIGGFATGNSLDALYFSLAGMDLLLAAATIVAGAGLRKGKEWASGLAMMNAGPVVATSIGMGCIIFPEYWSDLRSGGLELKRMFLIPRLLFYLVSVLLWPYVVLRIHRATDPESRLTHWAILSVGMLLGIVLTAIFHVWIRHLVPEIPTW